MLHMLSVKPARDKNLERLADDLVLRIAEDGHSTLVEEGDAETVVEKMMASAAIVRMAEICCSAR